MVEHSLGVIAKRLLESYEGKGYRYRDDLKHLQRLTGACEKGRPRVLPPGWDGTLTHKLVTHMLVEQLILASDLLRYPVCHEGAFERVADYRDAQAQARHWLKYRMARPGAAARRREARRRMEARLTQLEQTNATCADRAR